MPRRWTPLCLCLLLLCVCSLVSSQELPDIPDLGFDLPDIPDLPDFFDNINPDDVQTVLDDILQSTGNAPLADDLIPEDIFEAAPNAGVLMVYYDTVSFGGHYRTERRASLNIDWREEEFEPFTWRDGTMRFSVIASATMIPDISGWFTFKGRCGGEMVAYLTDAAQMSRVVFNNIGAVLPNDGGSFAGVSSSRGFTAGSKAYLEAGKEHVLLIAAATTESSSTSSSHNRFLQLILSDADRRDDFPIPEHWLRPRRTNGAYVSLYPGTEKGGLDGARAHSMSVQPAMAAPLYTLDPGFVTVMVFSARFSAQLLAPEEDRPPENVKLVVVQRRNSTVDPSLWVAGIKQTLQPRAADASLPAWARRGHRAWETSFSTRLSNTFPLQVDLEITDEVAHVAGEYGVVWSMQVADAHGGSSSTPRSGFVEFLEATEFGAKLEWSQLMRRTARGERVDMVSSELLGCTANQVPVGVAGKVVLLARGECFYVDKAVNAEKAGALAVIITQTRKYHQPSSMAAPSLGPDLQPYWGNITIPCLSMTFEDAAFLQTFTAPVAVNIRQVDAGATESFLFYRDAASASSTLHPVPTSWLRPSGQGGMYMWMQELLSDYNVSAVESVLGFSEASVMQDLQGQPSPPPSRQIVFADYSTLLTADYSETVEFRFKGLGWVTLWIDEQLVIWEQLPVNSGGKQVYEVEGSIFLQARRPVQMELHVDHNRKDASSAWVLRGVWGELQWRSPKMCPGVASYETDCPFRLIPQRNLRPAPCISGRMTTQMHSEFSSNSSCTCPLHRRIRGDRHCRQVRKFTCRVLFRDRVQDCTQYYNEFGYDALRDGDPPCSIMEDTEKLAVKTGVECRFDDLGALPAASPAPSASSQPQAFLDTTVDGFKYAYYVADESFAFGMPFSLDIEMTAFNFKRLSQPKKLIENVVEGMGLIGQSVTYSLEPGSVGEEFFSGGRLYIEVLISHDEWKFPIDALTIARAAPIFIDVRGLSSATDGVFNWLLETRVKFALLMMALALLVAYVVSKYYKQFFSLCSRKPHAD